MQKSFLTLDNEFLKYCEINNITDPEKLAKEIFQKGFTIVKYGEIPNGLRGQNTIIEKEVIKEVIVEKFIDRIVEKPIEVIKEVIKEVPGEVIKEVPIEIKGDTQIVTKEVIKEVTVDKIVEVINTDEINRLTEENKKLKEDLDKITSSLESFGRKGKLMKDSNMSSLYDE
jgi:F420-0:gamma-glutamyl ligase-like protein